MVGNTRRDKTLLEGGLGPGVVPSRRSNGPHVHPDEARIRKPIYRVHATGPPRMGVALPRLSAEFRLIMAHNSDVCVLGHNKYFLLNQYKSV